MLALLCFVTHVCDSPVRIFFPSHLVHSKNETKELTRKKIRSFWWTSSNRRVTNVRHVSELLTSTRQPTWMKTVLAQ